LDRAAVAVATHAGGRNEESPALAGGCGYLVRHLAARPLAAAVAAERECAVRYRGELAALYGALAEIDPTAGREGCGRRPLGYLADIVDDPCSAAQAEFRARYGGLANLLRGKLAEAYGRALARELAGWDT
jgi:hypothetical protein